MIYRTEHPNPQWERKNWRCLNGEWEFDFDFGKSAKEKELYKKGELSKKINVPFCPESDLSGIGYKDFIPAVCYRKIVNLENDEICGRVFLHFGAVDYKSYVYVNGELAITHIGGYSSFKVEITDKVKKGENIIFVIAEDDTRSLEQPSGKQCVKFENYACFYTRTTGIWQSIWLEFTPKAYIECADYYTDIENGIVTVKGKVSCDGNVTAKAFYKGKLMGEESIKTFNDSFLLQIKLAETHLWDPGHGRLYDLELNFGNDTVKSYFGMRSVAVKNGKFLLNAKPVFQRFVLDQGFYPDGIYTAKTDDELKRDIELSMKAGFNGARLHQKIFEKRFLYHCDKAGYMVWEEHANWGMGYKNPVAVENFICEWAEVLKRDFNNPSIIGWCPFNESWGYKELNERHRCIETVYRLTKAIDETRPCIAISGNYHIADMEIYDVHDYTHSLEEFRDSYSKIAEGIVNDQIRRGEGDIQPYSGQAVFLSEYGGFSLIVDEGNDWGYGEKMKSKEEFYKMYQDFTDLILENPHIMGFCYTQLYDVEQEKNGIYTFGRIPKLDTKILKNINVKKAKSEN